MSQWPFSKVKSQFDDAKVVCLEGFPTVEPAFSHIVGRFRHPVRNVDAKLGQYLAERARMVGEGVVQIDGDEFSRVPASRITVTLLDFLSCDFQKLLGNFKYPSRVPTVSARFQKKSSSGAAP